LKPKQTLTQIIGKIGIDPNGPSGFEEEALKSFLSTHYEVDTWRDELVKDIQAYKVTVERSNSAVKYVTYSIASLIAMSAAAGYTIDQILPSSSTRNTVVDALQITSALCLMITKAVSDPLIETVRAAISRLEAVLAYGNQHKLKHTLNWVELAQENQEEVVRRTQNMAQQQFNIPAGTAKALVASMQKAFLSPKVLNDVQLTIAPESKDDANHTRANTL